MCDYISHIFTMPPIPPWFPLLAIPFVLIPEAFLRSCHCERGNLTRSQGWRGCTVQLPGTSGDPRGALGLLEVGWVFADTTPTCISMTFTGLCLSPFTHPLWLPSPPPATLGILSYTGCVSGEADAAAPQVFPLQWPHKSLRVSSVFSIHFPVTILSSDNGQG